MNPEHKNYIDEYKYKIKSETAEADLFEFLKNKKVAVVGASPSLNGVKLGDYIDNFDVVIRINQGAFSSEYTPEDYGKRTDIIYLSQYARDRYTESRETPSEGLETSSDTLEISIDSNGNEVPPSTTKPMKISGFPKLFDTSKFIVSLTQIKQDDFPKEKWYCYDCKEEIKHGEEYGLNSEWFKGQPKVGHLKCIRPHLQNYFKFYTNRTGVKIVVKDMADHQKVFKHTFLTGILAVIDCIQYQASEVHMFGMDCYQAIKDALRAGRTTIKPNELYQDGYIVYEGTLIGNNGITHKDEDAQQLAYLKNLYDFQALFKTKLFIDGNLKNIFKKTFNHPERFKKYEKDFASFVRGKKVIVIGPSPFLEKKGLGSFIDSFDVVVRLNLGGDFCKSNPVDFGTRTDVTFINRVLRSHYVLTFPEFMTKSKFIAISTDTATGAEGNCHVCKEKIAKTQEIFIDNDGLIAHQDCTQLLDYGLCQSSAKVVTVDSNKLRKEIGENPLLGVNVLRHLLDVGASQINIAGFDFYQGFKDAKINASEIVQLKDLYSDGYIIYGTLDNTNKDKDGKQLEYFKKLYENNKTIFQIVDTKLLTLL